MPGVIFRGFAGQASALGDLPDFCLWLLADYREQPARRPLRPQT